MVKSMRREEHFHMLKRVFERCRAFKLRMNPLKCAFGVSSGKFLGFLVHSRGIDVDPAIATIRPLATVKELKELLREGLVYPKIHPWVGINHLCFHQIAQEREKL